ncbi:hypothetical protein [Acinetobacter schindleri]|uniref:hypothetical protein n=1 Tax=Acinetobacter schindleri TaxID=108981 RepID=UPI00241C17F0|nr:hypothetical protein [Acinetobacter schindleri]
MIFVYEEGGIVKLGHSIHENYIDIEKSMPSGTEFFIKKEVELPRHPIESWYIEDGEIKVDQQKLIEFNRQNMPTLTPIEFDLKLVQHNLYDAVQDLISNNLELKIAYNRATFFSRTSEFIDQARQLLDLTDEQVDEMWMS